MDWITKKVSSLKQAVEKARSTATVETTCIHGEDNCARCLTNQMDEEDYTWQNLEADDIKKVVYNLPNEVRTMMKMYPGKVVVAGGFIRALIANESIKDLDIFVPSEVEAKEWCKKAYISIDEIGDEYLSTNPTDSFGYEIQTVWRYSFKEPYEIPEQFDYTVVKAAIWYDAGDKNRPADFVGICYKSFYQDLARKVLVYVSTRDVERVMSIPRLIRYTQYGYSIDPKNLAEVILKTCLSLDLTNGFDGAFKQLFDAYQEDKGIDWTTITKPYIAPKKVVKKKVTHEYDWGS